MGRKSGRKSGGASGTLGSIFTILSLSFIGKIILYAFLAVLAVVITATAAGNDFDKFFRSLGVEVLVVAVVGWIVFLVRRKD